MKLPRDISADQLIAALARVGYTVTRSRGSHVRLTTRQNGEHHITVPRHDTLKVGTLASILHDVSEHLGITRDALLGKLFA